jgi:hypothetical protein
LPVPGTSRRTRSRRTRTGTGPAGRSGRRQTGLRFGHHRGQPRQDPALRIGRGVRHAVKRVPPVFISTKRLAFHSLLQKFL